LLAAVVLGAVSARELQAEDPRPPAGRSPLDRAVESLGPSDTSAPKAPGPASGDLPPTGSAPTEGSELGAIQSFFASWRLFHNSYLVGWLVGVLLALVGVMVVARDQVFLGAAVSAASTLGIAIALAASSVFPLHSEGSTLAHSPSWLCCDSFQVIMAVAFSVLAALATSRADRAKRESHEAITGWVFLLSTSLSVLVVAHSPHGLEEIHRIHSSSIIGATATDVGVFSVLVAATLVFLLAAGRRLLLLVMDPSMAAAAGMKVGRWAAAESLWLGLVVGLSIRTSGMLFTFGGLVLPPLVAKNLCREVRPMFFVAPVVALATNTLGFVLANRYDFPPAQMNVAVLCFSLLAAWGLRRVRGTGPIR
jgi:ABC-type Mn2+/Zn2+ transport system permease subunit